jgi:predicted nuclease of restriction endonuclease-like (RecB) superfamily
VDQLLVRVPWGHHRTIIDKCGDDVEKALFYVQKTVENGWSRNVLAIEIDGDLYSRQGKAVTNCALTMPDADSDLAQQLTKYCDDKNRPPQA